MFDEKDLAQIEQKTMTLARVEEQLELFKRGVPFLNIESAASASNGIRVLDEETIELMRHFWIVYLKGDRKIVKFVPASGAASRMFKSLFVFLEEKRIVPNTEELDYFFHNLKHLAFFDELNEACMARYKMSTEALKIANRYSDIIHVLLDEDKMNYGQLPKGLLLFHRYPKEIRTPFMEHLYEGALYGTNSKQEAYVHYSVLQDHLEQFKEHYMTVGKTIAERLDVDFHVSFSLQKPYTDTIAVDVNNEPFRLKDGSLLFRPGGHGALIENLNDLDADIIFIKNIDNVVPDKIKASTVKYKKVLAGVLVSTQHQIFEYLEELENPKISEAKLQIISQFVSKKLYIRALKIRTMSREELIAYLKSKLNRPLRVCGMVKNVGEPGGGPYLIKDSKGCISPQILESTQIDKNDPYKVSLMNHSTHFNPVDLVCGVKDYKGHKFDLMKFVDPKTGFISQKSSEGKIIRALELPGLWNGAMSDWTTIFVEVPISTFNPVKIVTDLLREEHQ